jgi:hypothetical protein
VACLRGRRTSLFKGDILCTPHEEVKEILIGTFIENKIKKYYNLTFRIKEKTLEQQSGLSE